MTEQGIAAEVYVDGVYIGKATSVAVYYEIDAPYPWLEPLEEALSYLGKIDIRTTKEPPSSPDSDCTPCT